MKSAFASDRRAPVSANPRQPAPAQVRDTHRSFDYGAGFGNRSGYSTGRRYADVPNRGLFHCG